MAIVEELEHAAGGLLYLSETDEPFEAFHWQQEHGSPSAARLRALAGQGPNVQVDETELSEFFDELTKKEDWFDEEEIQTAEKYERLLQTIQERLPGARVFWINGPEIEIYIVGAADEGGWAGVKTKAVET
ncbi:MAG TPA: nuclease A inhibitor family protein [Pirellulales bacterium]|nr:nuclease A inhibitor family protein [Pirellulales bacterium]